MGGGSGGGMSKLLPQCQNVCSHCAQIQYRILIRCALALGHEYEVHDEAVPPLVASFALIGSAHGSCYESIRMGMDSNMMQMMGMGKKSLPPQRETDTW